MNDVFFSFGGHDRAEVRRLVEALREDGLDVFFDEHIGAGEGITAEIERRLASSKIFLVYYSAGYPGRYACQFELTAALLAGRRDGRILVVNPESGVGHLYPVELADAAFVRPPAAGDATALAAFVAAVRTRVDAVDGVFGDIRFTAKPQWFSDRLVGSHGFVGRYRDQWELHSALHAGDFPMVREVPSGPVVTLTGIAGSGKSALVAAYAWQFGAAFPGGIFWISLTGATTSTAMAGYREELRRIGAGLGIDGTGQVDIANEILRVAKRALWVVDDVPADLDSRSARELVIPAEPVLRTVLISRQPLANGDTPVVRLGRMAPEDARELLLQYREPDATDADALALEELTTRLDGHPFSLRLAGRQVQDRQGLLSIADFVRGLAADPAPLDPATDLLRQIMLGLAEPHRLVLQVAALCGPAPVPVALLAAVGPYGAELGDILVELRDRQLADRVGDRWQFHSIVLDAARRFLDPVAPPAVLARTTADRLLASSSPDAVLPHAVALADSTDLDPGTTTRLRRFLIDRYRDRGEPVPAAAQWDRLLATGTRDPADLVAAAAAHLDAGGSEKALDYARECLSSGGPADRLMAQALDALGRLREADPHWARAAAVQTDDAAAELAYIRSRRLRGEMRTARDRATRLVNRLAGEDLQAARIELATIQMSTSAQLDARHTAEAVLRYYDDRDLPGHANAAEAESVRAQAWLTLHLLELNPDPAKWREAARSLRELRDRQRRTYGPFNLRTLSTEVEYGYALLCLGQPKRARTQLTETLARLDRRVGPDHPLTLRATLLLGRSYAQRKDYERSRDLHQQAYDGLRASLGPNHPDTLHAQYGLGIALILTGDRTRGRRLVAGVRDAAPASVGRKTDLYGQSVAALALLLLPGGVWKLLDRLTDNQPNPDDEP